MPETITHLSFVPVDFNPFENLEVGSIALSTESQKEIWASCMLGGDDASRGFNESLTLHLNGPLNKNALQVSFQKLIERNDSFRSVFSSDGKQIKVYEHRQIDIYFQDISVDPDLVKTKILETYIKQDIDNIFSLSDGPLIKAGLFKLSEHEHQFILTTHHIICDGWSLGIFFQDLGKLYSSYTQNIPTKLPKAPLFTEYSNDLQKFMDSEDYHTIEQFWINKFQDKIPVLDLPTDFKRPALRTYASNRLDYAVDKNLIAALKKVGLQNGCSLVITLMAAFEVLLHQITGQDDIVLGLPAADQLASGNYQLIGHCVNLLAIRNNIVVNESFARFLKRHKNSMLDAYEHQQITYGTLVKKLKIQRDPSRVPLVPVVFNIDMGINDDVNFYGLKHKVTSNPREFESFEIFLNIAGHEESPTLEWSYNTQLFKPSTIKKMMDGFEFLLRELVKDPDVLIGHIPSQDTGELIRQLSEWNNTGCDYPRQTPLHQLISERAIKIPRKTAITFDNQQITYKELNERANQLASILIKNQVKKGDKVGFSLDRSAEMVISILAIMKSGAIYIPLDPMFPLNRINYMLEDSQAVVLLTSEKYKGKYQSNAKELILEDEWLKLPDQPATDPEVAISGDDLVYILYTSGSTGMPKGVQIAHHNLVNFLYSMQKQPGMNNTDKLLAVTTISFDIAGLELFLPLLTGAEIILADTATAKDGRALLDIIKKEQVTIMQATPYTWRIMLEAGWDSTTPVKAICGGEALPAELADRLIKRASSLWNVYGPTETTIWSTVKQLTADDKVISIGRPVDNTSVYILDKFLRPLAPGVAGEIYIGGEGVSKGYLNRAELTAEKFVNDPFATVPGSKMYNTGDLGRFMEDGEIECLGRVDAQVKIRGYRIETGEIEYQLVNSTDIKEAVVIARPDQFGIAKLVAFVVVSDNDKITDEITRVQGWKGALKDSLPDYMVPDNFIVVAEMPLTPNGKIDKKELAKLGVTVTVEQVHGYVAPRTDIEKLVAGIWIEYLGIEKIGIYDNFFELGGHSLIAVQVMTRIEKETGKRLPLAALLECPTIHQLETFLHDGNINKWKSLIPIKPSGNKTPLYIVHGAGLGVIIFNHFSAHLDENQPIYGLQGLGIDGNDEPLETVEETAAFYISEILQQNPEGPYMIAGFSDGGIIAFEMAQQLKAMNKKVKMLGILDTEVENYFQNNSAKNRFKRMLIRLVPRLYHEARCLVIHPKKALIYQKQCIQLRFISMAKRIGFENKPVLEDPLVFIHKAMEKYESMLTNYSMKAYNGPIDLFRSKIRVEYVKDFSFLGWKSFILKEIKIHEVPGDHDDMLLPPNCVDFAHILQKAIDNSK